MQPMGMKKAMILTPEGDGAHGLLLGTVESPVISIGLGGAGSPDKLID